MCPPFQFLENQNEELRPALTEIAPSRRLDPLRYRAHATLAKQRDPDLPSGLVVNVNGIVSSGYQLPYAPVLVSVGRLVALCGDTEAEGLEEILEWFAAAQRAYGKKRLNRFILSGAPLRPPRKGWKRSR